MFDTMTVTKAAGGVLGAFLIFLLGKWAAELMYHVDGHGEAAYVIEVESSGGGEEAVEEVSFEDLLAQADVEKGKKLFKKCVACHKTEEGANATGPYLYGVVGRPVAGVAGFNYSDAMKAHGGEWTPEELFAFLESPKNYIPGNKMTFKGLSKPEDRANIIAYLDSLDD
ncbi:c-type cytochrome [Jhaorihella thermophila]|uniref:Cytochrome c n=1 Tax=Jhaorihella thermophila TaxID=488547 RepID=A0A1H5V8S6_9RHOB|nr:cytochrome c family protein [Jhaorihella thermophila]SEF82857.1 cytochrome c [Jhaorihella thermophila]